MGQPAAAPAIVTKGEFAALIGVSPGRVSQYIAEGKISGAALVGEGRSARIDVATARAQLRGGLDLSQRYGANGLGTNLGEPGEFNSPTPAEPAPTLVDSFEQEFKAERLEEIRRRNRLGREKELAERGQFILASDARAEMTAVAATMLGVFEGGLSDLAQAIAGKFGLPQRDVSHLIRGEFRAIRTKAAEAARKRAAGMPGLVIVEDDDADDED